MKRITSPLNVAAGIFIAIAVLYVSSWNKEQKRNEEKREQQEMMAFLNAHADDILLYAQDQLPVNLKEDHMSFEKIALCGDTLEIECHFSQLSTFYQVTDGNCDRALVRMLYEGFGQDLPALTLLKAYHVRVRTNLRGYGLQDFVVSPQRYHTAYNRFYAAKLPLQGMPAPNP